MSNKHLLMIAFHYPPAFGSSGLQRTLKFSRYLPDHGWTPQVLTAHPRAHPRTNPGQLAEIPADVDVRRAFALDTARHLAIRGHFPRTLALPDRWVSWSLGAIPAGLRIIRQTKPDLLWCTYPIATAALIGLMLHRLSGVPLVADLRDSMTEANYPYDARIRKSFLKIERRLVHAASRVVFTAPGTRRMYAARYPDIPSERWQLLGNGYDEENFDAAEARASHHPREGRPLRLVHSGILYPDDRDPRAFFAALRELHEAGTIEPGSIEIVLRGTGHDSVIRRLVDEAGIRPYVRIEAGVPYADALVEMLEADGLLLFQAASCNHQIPAKLYEYLRAGRPVFAITDPTGDTAATLRDAGIDTIARLDSREDLAQGFAGFVQLIGSGEAPTADAATVRACSRRHQTELLAQLLDDTLSDVQPALA